MTGALIFKIVILLLIGVILLSLTSGMIFLVKDKGDSNRMVKSLTVRVVLSILLFILLFVGLATGLIEPHGLVPEQTEKALQ
ncbi:MAG TPA: twin transmembrane helix small protein [Gammaproteobacteria bacterium]|nr:twin transmembrane helix small protein [Gammaproteobacteria bacterium]